jgi:hypothetical protein
MKDSRFPHVRGNDQDRLDRDPSPPSIAELTALPVVRLCLGAMGMMAICLILSLMS